MTAQNEKTLQFWDDYYNASSPSLEGNTSNSNTTANTKEWILHPSHAIFETLYERLPPPPLSSSSTESASVVRILEIGCGTSTLSRDFLVYCRDQKGRTDVSICATDVSPVCIHQNQQRDRGLRLMTGEEEEGCLEYEIFNIATQMKQGEEEEPTSDHPLSNKNPKLMLPNSFDMILDKGCLDTFLFRSRQRGTKKDALVRTVLNNIHALLKDPTILDDNEDDATTCSSATGGGVYTIISPRAKFRPVKEYPGFCTVERMSLDDAKGMLVPTAAPDVKQNGKLKRESLYLYTCYKKRVKEQQSLGLLQPKDTALFVPPADDAEACAKCGLTFFDFCQGEDPSGRGVKFWTRRFRGHCRHCRGNTATIR